MVFTHNNSLNSKLEWIIVLFLKCNVNVRLSPAGLMGSFNSNSCKGVWIPYLQTHYGPVNPNIIEFFPQRIGLLIPQKSFCDFFSVLIFFMCLSEPRFKHCVRKCSSYLLFLGTAICFGVWNHGGHYRVHLFNPIMQRSMNAHTFLFTPSSGYLWTKAMKNGWRYGVWFWIQPRVVWLTWFC